MDKVNKSEVSIKAQTLVSTSLSESLPDVEDSTSLDLGILLREGSNIRPLFHCKTTLKCSFKELFTVTGIFYTLSVESDSLWALLHMKPLFQITS